MGASLVKLARRSAGGRVEFGLHPIAGLEGVAREVESARPERLGLTGCGAPALAVLLGRDAARVGEFEAWARGSRSMLELHGIECAFPYLLVSVGTGTSALRVDAESARRVGGSALGGGALLGLARELFGSASFEALTKLAGEGDRSHVDLLISDIYPEHDFVLPGPVNAASFGKLARLDAGERPAPSDLADGLLGLVGENVALICKGLAAEAGVERVVFGGATLRDNPRLVATLRAVTVSGGLEAVFLPDGEFTGALGALETASWIE